jgi:hypothetical protein
MIGEGPVVVQPYSDRRDGRGGLRVLCRKSVKSLDEVVLTLDLECAIMVVMFELPAALVQCRVP